MKQWLLTFYNRHRRWILPVAFVVGFSVDIARLGRIDSIFSILQQGMLLSLVACILGWDLVRSEEALPPLIDWDDTWAGRVWRYRDALLHLGLGKLLSAYTLFYFKSASLFVSLAFMILLAVILVLNELREFGRHTVVVRFLLFSLCLLSYTVYLVPIFLRSVGPVPFLISLLTASAAMAIFFTVLRIRMGAGRPALARARKAYLGVLLLFTLAYLGHVIPPVPLSVQYMGIFHDVQKVGGRFELSFSRSKWKAWEQGDQNFMARTGDRVFCFVRVFSPAQFKDRLQIRWLYKDARMGWTDADVIPFEITGGRGEGYRGYTSKSKYWPGEWRVQVETSDGREMSRIYFSIANDASQAERKFSKRYF